MSKGLLFLCVIAIAAMGWSERETVLRWKAEYSKQLAKFLNSRHAAPGQNPDGTTTDETPPKGDAATAQPDATPAPLVAEKPAEPPPPPPPPLPPGLYVLRERVTIPTDAGVRAYAVGTEVTQTGEEAGQLVVTDGKNSFPVSPSKLTRDPVEVERIRRAKLDAAAARDASSKPQVAPAPVPPGPGNPDANLINRRRNDLKAALAAVDRELYQSRTALHEATAKQSMSRSSGRISGAAIATGEMEKRIQALENQRENLAAQFAALPR